MKTLLIMLTAFIGVGLYLSQHAKPVDYNAPGLATRQIPHLPFPPSTPSPEFVKMMEKLNAEDNRIVLHRRM